MGDFLWPERGYLGLGHVFQCEEVDDTVEYTSRVELLRCGEGLKSFDHGHSSRGILDLFALLLLLLVPFPDTCGYRIRKMNSVGVIRPHRLQTRIISDIV